MTVITLRWAVLGGALSVLPLAAHADATSAPPQDVAVVIGIQAYDHVDDLSNTRADAQAIAAMMAGFGYDVHAGYDLDKEGVEALLRRAILNIRDDARVFFFYAGHGIQIGRRNYLLTREATFDDTSDLPFQSVTLDRVSTLLGARSGSQLLMLDSCRNNPVADAQLTATLGAELYEAREGFEVFRPPLNTLVAFSTSPGEIALDGGAGGHSPYTAAVLDRFASRASDDAMAVLTDVRARVYEATANRQVPWESSTLIGPITLGPARDPAASASVPGALDDGDGDGAARGLALAALPAAVAIRADLDRTVDLTPALGVALAGATTVEVVGQPDIGTISVDAGRLSFAPRLEEIATATRLPADLTGQARLRLVRDGAARELTVDLTLRPHACDVEAGAPLDPQGVGLHRFPDQLRPAATRAACEAAVAEAPGTGRFHFQLGRALQARGDLADAYAAYARAADLGHVRANDAMAFLHVSPVVDPGATGIAHDRDRAYALWEVGVAAGDPYALHALGYRLLERGEDATARDRGFELLSRALELGHTYAMNNLGMYFLGEDTADRQPERGMAYLRASAARGDIYGVANLGRVRLLGLDGQAPDTEAAEAFYSAAADAGHPTAPTALGRMAERGQTATPGPRAAVGWYDMGLARGDAWGGANGAYLTANDLPGAAPWEAAARAGKALALNHARAGAAAVKVLDGLPGGAEDAAAQAILAALGEDIAVDGAFGPASRDALVRRATANGIPVPPGMDARARLILAARIHFAENPVRVDLF